MAPHHHLVQGSDFVLSEDVGLKLANEGGSYKHGFPIGFPAYPVTKKLVVAVDVDEGNFSVSPQHPPALFTMYKWPYFSL